MMKTLALSLVLSLALIACGRTNPVAAPVTQANSNAQCSNENVGRSFASEDGCNTCKCDAAGNLICTEMFCGSL